MKSTIRRSVRSTGEQHISSHQFSKSSIGVDTSTFGYSLRPLRRMPARMRRQPGRSSKRRSRSSRTTQPSPSRNCGLPTQSSISGRRTFRPRGSCSVGPWAAAQGRKYSASTSTSRCSSARWNDAARYTRGKSRSSASSATPGSTTPSSRVGLVSCSERGSFLRSPLPRKS